MLRKMTIILCEVLILLFVSSCSRFAIVNTDKSGHKLALTNCNIIVGEGSTIEDGVVLIQGDKLKKVGKSQEVDIPKGYSVIDLKQATVLPGFINVHVHNGYDEENLKNWLAGGITTVRDLSILNMDREKNIVTDRDELNLRSDTARLVVSSPIITVPNGYGFSFINSTEDAKEKVNQYIDMGVDVIKFSMVDQQENRTYAMPTEEELRAIVDTAHEGGKRAAVHITQGKYLQPAIDLGVDEINHMVMDPIDGQICKKMIDKDIYWIPTLELWEIISNTYGLSFNDLVTRNLGVFYREGGKIALGTDFDGFPADFEKGFPITEIRMMKEAGMTNMDIIIAGTKNAAYVCDMEELLGTVEEGKVADLLIVEGNPIENLEDLLNTYMVIHNGQIAFQMKNNRACFINIPE